MNLMFTHVIFKTMLTLLLTSITINIIAIFIIYHYKMNNDKLKSKIEFYRNDRNHWQQVTIDFRNSFIEYVEYVKNSFIEYEEFIKVERKIKNSLISMLSNKDILNKFINMSEYNILSIIDEIEDKIISQNNK